MKGFKPTLLSAEVKYSLVILWIVMPLLAKALYKFGFFWRNFVIIVKTIRRITLGYIFSWIWFFFQELHHRQSELADDQRIQNLGWFGRMPLDKIWNHPTSRKWRHFFQDGGHFWRWQQHLPQRFVSSIGNKDIIILSHLQLIGLFWPKYTWQSAHFPPFMLSSSF